MLPASKRWRCFEIRQSANWLQIDFSTKVWALQLNLAYRRTARGHLEGGGRLHGAGDEGAGDPRQGGAEPVGRWLAQQNFSSKHGMDGASCLTSRACYLYNLGRASSS